MKKKLEHNIKPFLLQLHEQEPIFLSRMGSACLIRLLLLLFSFCHEKKTSLKIGLLICFRLKVAKSIVTFQISKSIKHALNTRCIICKPLDLLAKVSIISNPNSNPKTNPCTRSDYRAGFQKTFQNLDCENF